MITEVLKTIFFCLCLGSPAIAGVRTFSGNFPKAYARYSSNLDSTIRARMKAGYSLFSKPWVQAPSSTRVRDGLGPYFNATSCMSCHPAMGRGAPPGVHHPNDPALLFKVVSHQGHEDHPFYGKQISPYGVQGLQREAKVLIRFSDFKYDLKSPSYSLAPFRFR